MSFNWKGLFSSLFGGSGSDSKTDPKAAAPQPVYKTVTLSSLPAGVDAMKAMPEFDRQDPYKVAAFTVAALCRFPESRDDCYAMINDLKGPEPISVRNKQFINDRFMDGKNYIPRSYFEGAVPGNDYKPAQPYSIRVKEQSNSRETDGYISLYLTSGGADSPRLIKLRQKISTGEWFLYQFDFLLGVIRIPTSQDKWA